MAPSALFCPTLFKYVRSSVGSPNFEEKLVVTSFLKNQLNSYSKCVSYFLFHEKLHLLIDSFDHNSHLTYYG